MSTVVFQVIQLPIHSLQLLTDNGQVEDIPIRVANTLFSKPDTVFSCMFTLPTSTTPEDATGGSEDGRPIKLGGMTAKYFSGHLLVMHSLYIVTCFPCESA